MPLSSHFLSGWIETLSHHRWLCHAMTWGIAVLAVALRGMVHPFTGNAYPYLFSMLSIIPAVFDKWWHAAIGTAAVAAADFLLFAPHNGHEDWVAPILVMVSCVPIQYVIHRNAQHALHLREYNKAQFLFLRELAHRTKNNLQLIQSIISLLNSRTDEPLTRRQLMAVGERVALIGRVHDHLYTPTWPLLNEVEGQKYIQGLVHDLVILQALDVAVSVDDGLYFDRDQAVPIGLILGEWLNHALWSETARTGKFTVDLHHQEVGMLALTVHDSRVLCEWQESKAGLGALLVQILASQVKGMTTMTVDDQGCTATLRFPLKAIIYNEQNGKPEAPG
jgi:two-component sensor histidine kinase